MVHPVTLKNIDKEEVVSFYTLDDAMEHAEKYDLLLGEIKTDILVQYPEVTQ